MAYRLPTIVGLLLLALPAASSAFTTATGRNFRANVDADGDQSTSVVASDGAGHFVVVWRTALPAASGQRFDTTGTRVGLPFTATTGVYHAGSGLALAVAPGGAFLVAWPYDDGFGSGIRAALFDAMGVPQGPDFAVNTNTVGRQENPTATADGAGNFIVAWEGWDGVVSSARRFDSAGVPFGADFSFGGGEFSVPDVAADAAGNFVIVWTDNSSHLRAQRYDATGAPQGAAFEVPTTAGAFATRPPSVAMAPGGDFVVAWEQEPGGESIRARRFDASGTPQGGDLVAETAPFLQPLSRPAVAVDAAGDFVVTWWSFGQIKASRFESDGTPQGGPLIVNSHTLLSRGDPEIGADGTGSFLLVWPDGIGNDIVAQRFSGGCGNGSVQPGEQCDDGNLADGDGCQSTCTFQDCFTCSGAPSSCTPITTCASGDGCCLSGCSAPSDLDCPRHVSGGSLVMRDLLGYSDQLTLRSRDPSLDTTPGTGIDPIADGAVLHVHSGSGGTYSGCFELTNSGTAAWTARGAPTSPVFVYSDRENTNGACRVARVRDGRVLRVRCTGNIEAPYASGAPLGSVAVRFASGATEYCALFGGQVRKDGPTQFIASAAPAPSYCPLPALPCPRRLPLGP